MIVNHPQSAQGKHDPRSREEIGAGLSELHIVAALVERHGNSRHSSGDSNPACSERGTSSQAAAATARIVLYDSELARGALSGKAPGM